MKKLYCNGKKDFCSFYDGGDLPRCNKVNCEYIDGSGAEVVEENDNTESEGGSNDAKEI